MSHTQIVSYVPFGGRQTLKSKITYALFSTKKREGFLRPSLFLTPMGTALLRASFLSARLLRRIRIQRYARPSARISLQIQQSGKNNGHKGGQLHKDKQKPAGNFARDQRERARLPFAAALLVEGPVPAIVPAA